MAANMGRIYVALMDNINKKKYTIYIRVSQNVQKCEFTYYISHTAVSIPKTNSKKISRVLRNF